MNVDDMPPTAPLEAYNDMSGATSLANNFVAGPATLTPANAASATALATFGRALTARRVEVARDETRILAKLKVLCAMAGKDYVYAWEVWDKQKQAKALIEGGTIKLANDLVRIYGNCDVDVRAFNEGTHTLFYARFTDLESGASLTRPFRQRNGQNVGTGMDAERRSDMIFQIGASKAIRNVVLNFLSTFATFALEESKKQLLEWVAKNGDAAKDWIERTAHKHNIAMARVEATVGRKFADWTVRDLAKVMMELRGVDDGLITVEDAYPSEEKAGEMAAAKAADKLNSVVSTKAGQRDAGGGAPTPSSSPAPQDPPAATVTPTPKPAKVAKTPAPTSTPAPTEAATETGAPTTIAPTVLASAGDTVAGATGGQPDEPEAGGGDLGALFAGNE